MKNSRSIIIVFAVLGALLLVYFIFNNGDEKRFQWYESFRADSDQPYGTLFIRKMLEEYHPEGTFTFNDKTPLKRLFDSVDTKEFNSYVFIGQSLYLDEEDVRAMVNFVDGGGDVFIACLEPPLEVLNSLYFQECGIQVGYQTNEVDSVNMNFFHDTLYRDKGFQYAFRYGSDDHPYSWNYVSDELFCDSTSALVPLGRQEGDHVNFIKISAGNGNLYVHSNPLVFTNYFLAKQEKVDYVSSVFSHLPGKNVVWDEYSKIPFSGNNNAYNSPLYYILQQPSLKYAWWLLLVTVVLYIFFFAKRQQRVIPVLEPKSNTSLQFVNLISALHYQNENHLDMAKKKMRYFLYFVRSKYGIHAEKFTEFHIRKLADKSRVNVNDVQAIFDQYQLIEEKFQHTIEANRLLNLYYSIENFYSRCK